MKALVLYYSHDGHTERLARRIANALGARCVTLTTERYRTPVLGYLHAAWDSLRGNLPKVDPAGIDLADCDTVAVGAPVWAGRLATPLRALLPQLKGFEGRFGVFVTSGGDTAGQSFDMAGTLVGRPVDATLTLPNKAEGTPEAESALARFVERMRGR